MQRDFSCTITIEEVGEVGIVDIFSENKESIDGVIARIKGIIAVPEIGENYKGKVKSVMPFGLFVEILPGKDGLVHVSQISDERVEKVSDKLKEGDIVKVKVLEVDKQGRIRLSMKAVTEGEDQAVSEA